MDQFMYQAQIFANIFQEKIRDITTERTIEEDVDNGKRVSEDEDENIFSLEVIQRIMLNTKA
jgi:hypothetical protein